MAAVIEALSKSEAEEQEWELRRDMAAVFRVSAREGWNEQIGNHNSLMLPGDGLPRFLINPRGYLFQELKASDLLVCDLDGNVLQGSGELRKVAFHIHARIHLQNPEAKCVVHVHPRWLTALSLLRDAELHLSHHNNLLLNDRVVYDHEGDEPVHQNDEGDRIAQLMGNKSVMVMRGHGVTVVGPTVHDAFDECFIAERTAMYQMTAMSTGQPMHALPERLRRNWHGAWGDKVDARLHLNAWGECWTAMNPTTRPDSRWPAWLEYAASNQTCRCAAAMLRQGCRRRLVWQSYRRTDRGRSGRPLVRRRMLWDR